MTSVFEIATKISMTNAVSPVLAIISQQALGLKGTINELQKSIGTLRGALAVGGGLALTGGLGLALGLKTAADHAKALSHELVQIQKLNISTDQLSQVRAEAIRVTRQVPGTNEVDAIKTYGSTYSMFGHEGAISLMKSLNEFAQAAGNTSGNYEKASHSLYEMIRAGDLMGKFVNEATHKVDPDKLKSFLDLGSKVILGTHGKVDANAWFMLAQQGGPALSNMDDRGLLEMAIATQAMGGPRAGTALTSLYQQMVGGKMTQFAASKLHELGLVGDYTVGRGGHILWGKGALDNDFTRTLQKRPVEAVEIVKKAMEAHGYDSIEKQVPQLFEVLGRQTAQRLVHDFLRNLPQIQGKTDRILGALGIGPSNRLQNSQDYTAAEHNLGEAWQNLMFAVAGPNSENAIGLMNRLTAALNSMTDAARTLNPETLQNIGTGLATLAGALTVGGGAALFAAMGPAGWLAAGVFTLGAAFASFPEVRTKVISDISTAVASIKKIILDIQEIAGGKSLAASAGDMGSNIAQLLSAAINSIPGKVAGAIANLPGAIASAIGGAIASGVRSAIGGIETHSEGGGGGGRGRLGTPHSGHVLPQNFSPAPATSGAPIHNIMYLDGEVVHRSVMSREMRANAHPRQAPVFDGYASYGGPGSQAWEA